MDIIERFWGKVAIGAPDVCWVWRGCRIKSDYGQFRVGKLVQYAHRVAWELTYGPIPDGIFIDHRCNNRLCMNLDHMRFASKAENCRNRKIDRDSSSGLKGATWHKGSKRWLAQIVVAGKHIYLGRFDTAELAHLEYCKAADALHGAFANHGV